jgi:hypothetical protein
MRNDRRQRGKKNTCTQPGKRCVPDESEAASIEPQEDYSKHAKCHRE